jgi:hypothetical protein
MQVHVSHRGVEGQASGKLRVYFYQFLYVSQILQAVIWGCDVPPQLHLDQRLQINDDRFLEGKTGDTSGN